MLNKNQFQDLQRYCDIVERIRRERSQTNPEGMSNYNYSLENKF